VSGRSWGSCRLGAFWGVLGGVGFQVIGGNFERFCSRTLVLSGNSQETLSDHPGSSQLRNLPLYYNQPSPALPSVPAPARIPKLVSVPAYSRIPKSCLPALEFPNCFSCQRSPEFPNRAFSSVAQRSQVPKLASKALCALYRRLHPSPVSLPYPPRDRRSTGLLWLCFLALVVGRGSRLSPPCHPFSLLRFPALVNSDTAQGLGTGFVG